MGEQLNWVVGQFLCFIMFQYVCKSLFFSLPVKETFDAPVTSLLITSAVVRTVSSEIFPLRMRGTVASDTRTCQEYQSKKGGRYEAKKYGDG
ncbi:unnamed protein product [Toxocara canis]|uniref:Secreted protein n=1 Tax=Toxocara canis TaxID=6265 RepID=A0A183UFH0_TOXCA|nr:unnamed protein product [Toxocara canis]